MTKEDLFLELARPNQKGVSRWVPVSEFVGQYKPLQLGNGGSWCRTSSSLAKKYIVELDKSKTSGNSIDRVRLVGFNNKKVLNQNIRKDNTSGVKGVNYDKRKNLWVARITVNGKRKYLGRRKKFEDAVKLRKDAEKKYWK